MTRPEHLAKELAEVEALMHEEGQRNFEYMASCCDPTSTDFDALKVAMEYLVDRALETDLRFAIARYQPANREKYYWSFMNNRPVSRKSFLVGCDKMTEACLKLNIMAQDLDFSVLRMSDPNLKLDYDVHTALRADLTALQDALSKAAHSLKLTRDYHSEAKARFTKSVAPVKDFIHECTIIWLRSGKSVRTTAGGNFDQFLSSAYQAAFCKESESSSRHLIWAKQYATAIQAKKPSKEGEIDKSSE